MTHACPWIDPAGDRLSHPHAIGRMAAARVVLLGERHDRAKDHRWQTTVLAGLAARRDPMIVGFEMFPRRVDSALAAWVAGRLDPAEFLAATDWAASWGFDPALYMPLFDLCRDLGVSMHGLNIDRSLVTAIGRDGWDVVPPEERGWLTPARPAAPGYRRYLFEITGGVREGRAAQAPEDPAFDRFVRAQQAWDRAFGCALAAALSRTPDALAVGIIGRGHLEYGYGVADQLDDLGLGPTLTALPDAPPGSGPIADLVFEAPAS